MKHLMPLALLAAAAVLAALAGAARQLTMESEGYATLSPSQSSAAEATQFDQYPLFWLGEAFDNLPLAAVIRDLRSDDPTSAVPTARDGFYFVYGDCTASAHGGCAPPLQLYVTLRCYMPPELLDPVGITKSLGVARGGAVTLDIYGDVTMWTGEVSVTIFSSTDELSDRAIAALEPANLAALGSDATNVITGYDGLRSNLAPPGSGSCDQIQERERSRVPGVD